MDYLNTILEQGNGIIEPKGWMLEFLKRDAKGITGNLNMLCPDASQDIFGKNKVKNETRGWWSSWWPGETEGNWLEAFVRLALILKDNQLIKQTEDIINNLLLNQEKDGYIGIYQSDYRYNNGRRSGELWTQSRVMLTLFAYYESNKSMAILQALCRMADNIIQNFGPLAGNRSLYEIPDEDGSKSHSLMIIEPLLMLYNKTRKKEYLEFCVFLYDDYSKHGGYFPGNDLRMENALDASQPLIGHGPHTCEQLRIPLMLYMATGNKKYEEVFYAVVSKLKDNMVMSGSCKSDEMIGAYMLHLPENRRNGNNLGGSIPLPTTGYEYCSTTELMFSFIYALYATGNMFFADMEEWLIMNAAMAAKQFDGKGIEYLCADNLYDASKSTGDRWDYSPTHMDAAVCCAPNSCKVMPYHVSRMWMMMDENPTAVFYGPCVYSFSIKNQKIVIHEDTEYPFENIVRFTICTSKPATFSLILRIPKWSDCFALEINGVKAETVNILNGAIELKRTWKDMDFISLQLNCNISLHKAPDGTQALQYGPLLYSLKIREKRGLYFAYDVDGFYDINYTPEDGQNWDYTLVLDSNFVVKGASVKTIKVQSYLWENPPVKIRTLMLNRWSMPEYIDLVPIGCTILRRTTFPVFLDKKNIYKLDE